MRRKEILELIRSMRARRTVGMEISPGRNRSVQMRRSLRSVRLTKFVEMKKFGITERALMKSGVMIRVDQQGSERILKGKSKRYQQDVRV